MALLTSVLVRGINNLSDARYCAGMGADGLIFTLDPTLPAAVDAATVKELAAWVAGVELIGEFGAAMPVSEINRLVEECGLHRVLLPDKPTGADAASLTVPAIIKVLQLAAFDGEYHHRLLESLTPAFPAGFELLTQALAPGSDADKARQLMAAAAATTPLWLNGDFTPEVLPALLAAVRPAGLVLEGGNEIKPGLRDFTELEAVFEALEE
jgi:phosphoribosylanthranilate isomerase